MDTTRQRKPITPVLIVMILCIGWTLGGSFQGNSVGRDKTLRFLLLREADIAWSAEQHAAQSASPRGSAVTWGMTKEQVKSMEKKKSPLVQEIREQGLESLIYHGQLFHLDSWIVYIFAEGQLVRIKYVITETHVQRNDYLRDYHRLKARFTEQYGNPVKEKQVWKNDRYKHNAQEWGMAVSQGHLGFLTSWETSQTDIALVLRGANNTVKLEVQYRSKRLQMLEENATQKKALEAR